jgi:hypothetical protein
MPSERIKFNFNAVSNKNSGVLIENNEISIFKDFLLNSNGLKSNKSGLIEYKGFCKGFIYKYSFN